MSSTCRPTWPNPETLRPVLDGAAAMFLLPAGEDPQAIIDVAKAGGARRIVLLSSLGAATRPAHFRHFVAFEDAVRTLRPRLDDPATWLLRFQRAGLGVDHRLLPGPWHITTMED